MLLTHVRNLAVPFQSLWPRSLHSDLTVFDLNYEIVCLRGGRAHELKLGAPATGGGGGGGGGLRMVSADEYSGLKLDEGVIALA